MAYESPVLTLLGSAQSVVLGSDPTTEVSDQPVDPGYRFNDIAAGLDA